MLFLCAAIVIQMRIRDKRLSFAHLAQRISATNVMLKSMLLELSDLTHALL